MSFDDHKQMSRRAIGMWSSNNSDKPEDIFAENYVNHQEPDVEGGVSDKSLAAWKELVSDYHKSFSNSKALVLMQIAEGDLVATRWEWLPIRAISWASRPPDRRRPVSLPCRHRSGGRDADRPGHSSEIAIA